MKKLIIVLLLLCVTGCSVEYNVSLDEKNISETTKISEENSLNFDKMAYIDLYYRKNLTYREAIKRFYKNPVAIDINQLDLLHTDVEFDYDIYNVKEKKTQQQLGLTYQYDFDYDNFANSTFANACYNRFAFLNQDGTYYVSTSDMVTCFEIFPLLDDITIHVTSYYEVLSHNADQQDRDRNEYTWVINRQDAQNKPIQIVVNTSKKARVKRNLMDYFKENPFIIGVLLIVAIGGLIAIPVVVVKNKKNNEI